MDPGVTSGVRYIIQPGGSRSESSRPIEIVHTGNQHVNPQPTNGNIATIPSGYSSVYGQNRFAAYRDHSATSPLTSPQVLPSSQPHANASIPQIHAIPNISALSGNPEMAAAGTRAIHITKSLSQQAGQQIYSTNGMNSEVILGAMNTISSTSAVRAQYVDQAQQITRELGAQPQREALSFASQRENVKLAVREDKSDVSTSITQPPSLTTRQTIATLVLPSKAASETAGSDPPTPRVKENESSRGSLDSTSDHKISVELACSTTEIDRVSAAKLSSEITHLIKEREKLRAQDTTATSFPAGVLSDLSRQNNEIMKERDLLRTQFEEVSNRYQVLQRSKKVLEEQAAAEHEKAELANKKLKDMEANAISLQNHHQVLARENQLLKEQLGKVLRLNEAEKLELQNKVEALEVLVTTLKQKISEAEQQISVMSQKIQSNELQSKSREDVLKVTSYALEKGERCMQKTASFIYDRKVSEACFISWKGLNDFRKTGILNMIKSNDDMLKKVFLDEWARIFRIEKTDRKLQQSKEIMQISYEDKLAEAANIAKDREQSHLESTEALKTDFALKEKTLLESAHAAQEDHQEKIRQLESKSAAQLSKLREEFESTTESLKSEKMKALAEQEAEWSGKTDLLLVSHRLEISEMNAQHESTIAEQEARWTRNFADMTVEHDKILASLKAKHERILSDKEADWKQSNKEFQLKHESEISLLKANFEASQVEKDEQLAKKHAAVLANHAQEKSSLISQYEEALAEKEALWVKKFEDARNLQENEVTNLTARFEGIHTELREKLLSTRTAANSQIEQLRVEQSKSDREWRQKLIEKERALAAHLEEMERQRVQSVDEIQKELQSKEKEWASKMDAMRAEHARSQEDWRSKLLSKEKELASKMEAAREASIRAQEEFQNELQSRELEFKAILERKEIDCQALLDAHLSKSSHTTVELLQSKINSSEAALKDKEQQLRDMKTEKTKLQNEVHSALTKEQSLRMELEEIRSALKSANETYAARTAEEDRAEKIISLQNSLQEAERMFTVEKQKASTLSLELEAASQELIKRGDLFNQSMKAVEDVVKAKDIEVQELKDKFRSMNVTNAKLTAELDSSSSTSDSFKDQIFSMQKELEYAQKQKQSLEEQWQERYSALEKRSANDNERVSDGGFEQQLAQAAAEAEHLRRLVASLEQENSTMSTELDNVLVENAQLRHRIDTLQFNEDGQRLHDTSTEKEAGGHGSWALSLGRRSCGVHTLRLKHNALHAWRYAIHEMRMWGKNLMFSCLDYFVTADGCVAEWLPVGRLRKSDFEIKNEKIGSGTFAEVLRGEIKIPCAVKRIKGPVQQKELLEFVREGEMMRAVSHPCIIKLIGIHTEGGQYHLLQEYAAGPNLFDYLHKYQKTVPIGRQLSIAVQLCDALIHLHDLRIVHRDVKTQNIIYMEKSGTIKLCDFGLARLMPFGVHTIDPKHLGTGGTPAYQGPEVLKRHPVGLKLDLYGFAISLWEIYTCKLPWSDCSLDQMTVRVAVQKERPRIPPDMPREYAEILARCWHDDPGLRPEFIEILRPLNEIHESLNPNARLTMSASSNASTIFGSRGSAGPELPTVRSIQQASLVPLHQVHLQQPLQQSLQPPLQQQSLQPASAQRYSAAVAQF